QALRRRHLAQGGGRGAAATAAGGLKELAREWPAARKRARVTAAFRRLPCRPTGERRCLSVDDGRTSCLPRVAEGGDDIPSRQCPIGHSVTGRTRGPRGSSLASAISLLSLR